MDPGGAQNPDQYVANIESLFKRWNRSLFHDIRVTTKTDTDDVDSARWVISSHEEGTYTEAFDSLQDAQADVEDTRTHVNLLRVEVRQLKSVIRNLKNTMGTTRFREQIATQAPLPRGFVPDDVREIVDYAITRVVGRKLIELITFSGLLKSLVDKLDRVRNDIMAQIEDEPSSDAGTRIPSLSSTRKAYGYSREKEMDDVLSSWLREKATISS